MRTLAAGVLAAYEGISVEDFERSRMRSCAPCSTRRSGAAISHVGMPDGRVAQYLEANGFANYIASGGGRDFMRPVSQEMYGIPRSG